MLHIGICSSLDFDVTHGICSSLDFDVTHGICSSLGYDVTHRYIFFFRLRCYTSVYVLLYIGTQNQSNSQLSDGTSGIMKVMSTSNQTCMAICRVCIT